jgi:hypothetical protein
MKLVPLNDYKEVATTLKRVYKSPTEEQASKNWTIPIRRRRSALNYFMIIFETQLSDNV